MRFVKALVAAAALGMAGQAGAYTRIIGTATADGSGYFSIPAPFVQLGHAWRGKFIFDTTTPVTSQVTGQLIQTIRSTRPNYHPYFLQQPYPFATSAQTGRSYATYYKIGYPPSSHRDHTWVTFSAGSARLNVITDPGATVDYTLTIQPVPEPAVWMLIILGFGAIGFAMRGRARALTPEPAR